MQDDWLSRRVALLEQRVEHLERVPSEISALREDMNSQFVAVRSEMATEFSAVRSEMDLRFDAVHQVLISLQTQIRDNHRQMLVLHEEVISRIVTIGEGRAQPPPKSRKKP